MAQRESNKYKPVHFSDNLQQNKRSIYWNNKRKKMNEIDEREINKLVHIQTVFK